MFVCYVLLVFLFGFCVLVIWLLVGCSGVLFTCYLCFLGIISGFISLSFSACFAILSAVYAFSNKGLGGSDVASSFDTKDGAPRPVPDFDRQKERAAPEVAIRTARECHEQAHAGRSKLRVERLAKQQQQSRVANTGNNNNYPRA